MRRLPALLAVPFTAATLALVATPTSATAATGSAASAASTRSTGHFWQAAVDGCPGGDVCGYGDPVALAFGTPTWQRSVAADEATVRSISTGPLTAVVNNTDPQYTSEGSFLLKVAGLVCMYVPDARDQQAPDTVQNPADPGTPVDAIAVGPTRESVESIIKVDIGDCG